MNVKHLLKYSDDEMFKEKLQDFLNEQHYWIDLRRMCRWGGSPDIDEVEVGAISRTTDGITCPVTIGFTETIPTFCHDHEELKTKSCVATLIIDTDGDVDTDDVIEQWDGREYST